jgi:hypothetical protein
LALTPDFAKLSISPESSDGFASVGTILPKEEAALLPGGLFAFSGCNFWVVVGENSSMRKPMKKIHFDLPCGLEDCCNAADAGSVRRGTQRSEGKALHVSRSASCVADNNRSFVTRYFDMAHVLCRRRGSRRN